MKVSVSLWTSGSIWAQNMGAFYVWQVDERRRPMTAYERGREREEVQGGLKKHCVLCWQALQSNPLAVQRCFFFFFARPRLCHLIFKCRGNWRRAPPRPPAESSGISQRAPTRSTRCRASACTGGREAAHPHRSRPSLASVPIHTCELCVCVSLSLTHTHTHTNTMLSHRGSHAYAVTCFSILWQLSKNNSKIPLDFSISEQVGMG